MTLVFVLTRTCSVDADFDVDIFFFTPETQLSWVSIVSLYYYTVWLKEQYLKLVFMHCTSNDADEKVNVDNGVPK